MDDVIDTLIKPPVKKFEGFDWKRSGRLRPKGDADREKLVEERLRNRERKEDAVVQCS